MPAKLPFESSKQSLWQPPKIELFHISVFHVVADAIGKDVLDANVGDVEAVKLEKLATFAATIRVGNGASGLGFGILGDEVRQLPKLPLAFRQYNPRHLVRPSVI